MNQKRTYYIIPRDATTSRKVFYTSIKGVTFTLLHNAANCGRLSGANVKKNVNSNFVTLCHAKKVCCIKIDSYSRRNAVSSVKLVKLELECDLGL